jgi:hypothetical protein
MTPMPFCYIVFLLPTCLGVREFITMISKVGITKRAPWNIALEELIVIQLMNKIPASHGTQTFIVYLTQVRNLFLS